MGWKSKIEDFCRLIYQIFNPFRINIVWNIKTCFLYLKPIEWVGSTWYNIIAYVIITYGIIIYGIIRYGMITYGIITYGIITYSIITYGIII